MMRYFGAWSEHSDMVRDMGERDGAYNARMTPEEFPKDEEVIFASYELPDYDGYGFVLWRRGEGLFLSESSHCSCNGLEFDPEPTTVGALRMKRFGDYGYGEAFRKAMATWLASQGDE